MKTKIKLSLLILIALLLYGSCSIKKTNQGCIQDFRIRVPIEPNCPSLSFILITSHVQEIKSIYNTPKARLGIKVKGSFFNNPEFHHGDWILTYFNGDSIIMSSRTCYFADKNQKQLDSIALYSTENLSITIKYENDSLLFSKCKN